MIRVGLICNTTAAFPLVQWTQSQGCLAGIGVLDQESEFFSDINFIVGQLNSNFRIFQKENLTAQLINWQAEIGADIVLVLGFPYKINKLILDKPAFGFFNIHFGKLPEYGGSFPVFWQISDRVNQGVLTIHKMNESFDRGPIAVEIPFEINSGQTYGMVDANYSFATISGVFQLLNNILNNTLVLKEQTEKIINFLPKPTLTDLIINWQKMEAHQIVGLIKATNPWNRGAIARINGLDVKIIEAKIGNGHIGKTGEVTRHSGEGMEVACMNDTSLIIKILYSQYGYLESENLGIFGIKSGDTFEQINVLNPLNNQQI